VCYEIYAGWMMLADDSSMVPDTFSLLHKYYVDMTAVGLLMNFISKINKIVGLVHPFINNYNCTIFLIQLTVNVINRDLLLSLMFVRLVP
jgi:hypothetical protein